MVTQHNKRVSRYALPIVAPVLVLSGVLPLVASSESLAQGADSGTRIYPALHRMGPALSDPAQAAQWPTVQANTDGIWMNAVGSTADQVAGIIEILDGTEYPVILPGVCDGGAGAVSCQAESSLSRVNTANDRLADSGKELVAADRAFNLAAVIDDVPIADIVAAINASESDPAYAGIRSGILVHPRDGLNEKLAVTKQAIDAIDAGGVVAIEVSPSLLDANIVLSGAAAVFTYAQSQGKQAVWLMNGPRGSIDEWLANSKVAIDRWKAEWDLSLDVIAPIATLLPGEVPILPEGDGSWPPPGPTYVGMINSLEGLIGTAGGSTPPPTGPPPTTVARAPFALEPAASGAGDLRPAVRLGNWAPTPEAIRTAALDGVAGSVSAVA